MKNEISKGPEAPAHFSVRAKRLWNIAVFMQPNPKTAQWEAYLQTALEALDRADLAREAIHLQGMTVAGEGTMVHLNPLLRVERDNRQLFAQLWRDLGMLKR